MKLTNLLNLEVQVLISPLHQQVPLNSGGAAGANDRFVDGSKFENVRPGLTVGGTKHVHQVLVERFCEAFPLAVPPVTPHASYQGG